MSSSLLPPNSTEFEKDIEKLARNATELALCIRDIWSAETCPINLLPWLAWANSVDGWDDNWPEATKRNVVKTAYETHRYKGTPFAVQNALDGLGIASSIQEWWEAGGGGVRGTMTVTALLNENLTNDGDGLITPAMLALVEQTVQTAKRGSIHFDTQLGIALTESVGLTGAAASGCGVSDSLLASGAVVPSKIEQRVAVALAEHSITAIDTEIKAAPALPGVAAGALNSTGAVRHTALHDHTLKGVA